MSKTIADINFRSDLGISKDLVDALVPLSHSVGVDQAALLFGDLHLVSNNVDYVFDLVGAEHDVALLKPTLNSLLHLGMDILYVF